MTHNGRNLSLAALVLALLTVIGLKAPHAAGTFSFAFRHIASRHIVWFLAGLGAELVSFLALGVVYWLLLRRVGARLRSTSAALLVFSSSGLLTLLPGGTLPASGWLADQMRRRGVDQRAALWSIVAASFAVAVTALGLLLVGCWMAGVGPRPLLIASAVVLFSGAATFVRLAHRLRWAERWLARHGENGRLVRLVHRFVSTCAELAECRAGVITGSFTLLLAAFSWLCQWLSLVFVFRLVGFGTTSLHSLFFAFTASEVLSSVLPLPSGIGVVEGGLVGALALTGTPFGHAIVAVVVFRVVSYWIVTGAATLSLVVISHRSRDRSDEALGPDQRAVPPVHRSPAVSTTKVATTESPA